MVKTKIIKGFHWEPLFFFLCIWAFISMTKCINISMEMICQNIIPRKVWLFPTFLAKVECRDKKIICLLSQSIQQPNFRLRHNYRSVYIFHCMLHQSEQMIIAWCQVRRIRWENLSFELHQYLFHDCSNMESTVMIEKNQCDAIDSRFCIQLSFKRSNCCQ